MSNKYKINISYLTDTDIYELVLQRKLYRFPRHFWEKPNSLQSAKEITIYLLEKKLKWSDNDIKEKLTQKTFTENKLNGMITMLFKGSPYEVLNNAYPNKFKPWELKITPSRFWNEKTAYKFIKWIIEEKYKWNSEDIKENFSKTWLINSGYDGAMDYIKENTFEIINKLYPNKFKPWELKQVYMNYWTERTMGEALKWLIEDNLKLDIEKDKFKITNEFLYNNGLGRLSDFIHKKKNQINLYELVNMAYPNKFKEWEICNMDLWTDKKKIEATKWLVEDKLKLNPKTDLNKIKARHFIEYGLSGLLMTTDNSPRKLLKLAYKTIYNIPYK